MKEINEDIIKNLKKEFKEMEEVEYFLNFKQRNLIEEKRNIENDLRNINFSLTKVNDELLKIEEKLTEKQNLLYSLGNPVCKTFAEMHYDNGNPYKHLNPETIYFPDNFKIEEKEVKILEDEFEQWIK